MNYRLVLWDFDGTLADSLPMALEVYNRVAPRHGALPMTDPDAMRDLTSRELIKRHNIRCHRFPFLIREFLAEQSRNMDSVQLHEHIAETLEVLTRAGVRQAIVSSNSESNIRVCLAQNAVLEHFEFVVGIRSLFGKKRALKQALKLTGLAPDEVLYVGDETRDVVAAHQVGIPIACVTWGINSEIVLAEQKPEHIITSARQLLEIVRHPQNPPPDQKT